MRKSSGEQPTLTVTTRLVGDMFMSYATFRHIGEVVIGSGRDEYQSQLAAAKLLDGNYPDNPIVWVGGYHGGNTKGVRPSGGYWPTT